MIVRTSKALYLRNATLLVDELKTRSLEELHDRFLRCSSSPSDKNIESASACVTELFSTLVTVKRLMIESQIPFYGEWGRGGAAMEEYEGAWLESFNGQDVPEPDPEATALLNRIYSLSRQLLEISSAIESAKSSTFGRRDYLEQACVEKAFKQISDC